MPNGVVWSEEHGGYWAITGHAECRAIAGAQDGFAGCGTLAAQFLQSFLAVRQVDDQILRWATGPLHDFPFTLRRPVGVLGYILPSERSG
jgi:hypothetical protein